MNGSIETRGGDDGKLAREHRPRSSLAQLTLSDDRDPVAIVSADDPGRLEWLLGERYRRMSTSAFACYRGAAAVMAHDLGDQPNTGIHTQLCGDAHLSNFGLFAAPDRALLFDVNDFDESDQGPFEWDVQRLAASCVLAVRDGAGAPGSERRVAQAAVVAYQDAMRRYAQMGELELWYQRVEVEGVAAMVDDERMRARIERSAAKARRRDAASAAAKLTEVVDGRLRFRDDPPLLLRMSDLDEARIDEGMAEYRSTLSADRRALLDRFEVLDIAHKVVGVGSVGTRCLVVLLAGRHHGEPLILQFKQAGPSVLEGALGPSAWRHGGERVVSGQRLMQAASDIFLGWTTAATGEQYYWRQLRDMKWSPDLTRFRPQGLERYAGLCGEALARAHARGGNRVAIATYLGKSRVFADAVTEFAVAYATLAARDHRALVAAVGSGRLPADEVVVPDLPNRRSGPPSASPVESVDPG